MKKTLLSLALLCCTAMGVQAQTNPWTALSGSSTFGTDFRVTRVKVVNAATIWGLGLPSGGTALNTWVKSVDGGNTWTSGPIQISSGMTLGSFTAVDASTAWFSAYVPTGGGEVRKTTDGGATWVVQPTAAFNSPTSFVNSIHFFDANNGVVVGDPAGGSFEIYTTANGGTTWTRVPASNIPAPTSADEYGNVGAIYALGNTVWFGGYNFADAGARIFKSTDRGLTWTASQSGFADAVSLLAFTDQNRGIASNGLDLISTANGGTSWQTLTSTGNFYQFGLDAVPGAANTYVSSGTSAFTLPSPVADFGTSYSRNGGQSWTDLDRGVYHVDIDFFSPTVGYTTGRNTGTERAMYRFNSTILGNKKDVASQNALSVYPNPSSNGVFTLNLASGIKANTDVRVFDALGRTVLSKVLKPNTAMGSEATIDLNGQKAGVYTLELRTEAGVAQQKLVIK